MCVTSYAARALVGRRRRESEITAQCTPGASTGCQVAVNDLKTTQERISRRIPDLE